MELSEIQNQLKKEKVKPPNKRDSSFSSINPTSRKIQKNFRIGGIKQSDQGSIINKVGELQKFMIEFKSKFFTRESRISTMLHEGLEMNMMAQMLSRTAITKSVSNYTGQIGTKSKFMLYNRIQELQKLNNDLLAELRMMNAKLMDSQIYSESVKSPPNLKTDRSKSFTASKDYSDTIHRRACSQFNDPNIERKLLQGKVVALTKQLERMKQNQSMIENHQEYFNQPKISYISSCIDDFLSAMSLLQSGVLNSNNTIEDIRNDIEVKKAA